MKYLQTLPLFLLAVLLTSACGKQNVATISSPNRQIQAKLTVQGGLQYLVTFNKDTIIDQSHINLTLVDGKPLGQFEVLTAETQTTSEQWEHTWGKRKQVSNHYNELKVQLREQKTGLLLNLYVRAYNDGVGLRYGFPEQDGLKSIQLASEKIQFAFTKDFEVWRADYKTYKSSQEQEFEHVNLSDIKAEQLIGMPLLVKLSDRAYSVVTEANLTDWAGAFLRADDAAAHTLVTDLAPYPQDSTVAVKRNTPALSPWRVIMIADEPGKLIESDLIANLNEPLAFDASWIEPGASAWDWWWSNKYAPSADFELGPNQETMKYFIDFAAQMGWEYQIVDWQWYGEPFGKDGGGNPDADITTCIDGINIKELVEYARAKDVKIIVWMHWEHLQKQMDEALALYEKWGVSGIKVDFMDRQDQQMVNFYHQVAKTAAKHKLVVDFHGAYKPTGVSRTYPNLITREGVMGNEYNKWSKRVTPQHNVTLAFTRGLLGEMDYTPVAFRNVKPADFVLEGESADGSPMVQTTRCHQLAMPVVYESAFTVFCDSPDNYGQGIGTEFLKLVPTTWHDTKVLAAQVGNYIAVARQSGNKWFVGGMTDADERQMVLNLGFLEAGTYKVILFEDAQNANETPSAAVRKELSLTNADSLRVSLASGGGFAAIIEPVR